MDIIGMLKKAGIPFKIIEVKGNPKVEKEVHDYIMGIERAHKRAAKSKLRFDKEKKGNDIRKEETEF